MSGNRIKNEHGDNGCSRRRFLGYAGGALAAGAMGSSWAGAASPPDSAAAPSDRTPETKRPPLTWGNLLHLSYNMWSDRPVEWGSVTQEICYQPYLRFDDKLWQDLTRRMADVGMNLLLIDVGDGIQYQSHPEISVRGAWSADRLGQELARLRKLGLEPIPKLNFSTAHDAWLGPYSRQVSTPVYYKVCEDLIDEVIRRFDKPRLFHLGYDEETPANQAQYAYLVVRQYELWWHDFDFFRQQVERRGVRPWIWSDRVWHFSEEFLRRMPKSVLQSNWYYGLDFGDTAANVQWYGKLDEQGYDQVPTGSTWGSPKNFGLLVEYCRKKITPARLKGFLQTPWLPTLEKFRAKHFEAIDAVAAAIAAYPGQTRPPQGATPTT
jgi:hypothetical protein